MLKGGDSLKHHCLYYLERTRHDLGALPGRASAVIV